MAEKSSGGARRAQIQQHAEMVRAFVKEGKDAAFAQGIPN
jgi:hypothetical protein